MPNLLEDTLVGPRWNTNWHMSPGERAILIRMLEQTQPDVSIEIGTFLCGSLKPISHYSKSAYTFDIDANHHRAHPLYGNVTFVTGDSAETLPPIIDDLNSSLDRELNFILVDGSHETEGVAADIDICLRYIPKRKPLVILMHDSSNPQVRQGIKQAKWSDCSYVHELDLDFSPGRLYDRPDIKGQIWGGLAAALIMPTPRKGPLVKRADFAHSLAALSMQTPPREALLTPFGATPPVEASTAPSDGPR